ncbi:MAG: hypothetical protein ACTSQF_12880 [Candidatus Heimdallarchaeaceae archaeon]
MTTTQQEELTHGRLISDSDYYYHIQNEIKQEKSKALQNFLLHRGTLL